MITCDDCGQRLHDYPESGVVPAAYPKIDYTEVTDSPGKTFDSDIIATPWMVRHYADPEDTIAVVKDYYCGKCRRYVE